VIAVTLTRPGGWGCIGLAKVCGSALHRSVTDCGHEDAAISAVGLSGRHLALDRVRCKAQPASPHLVHFDSSTNGTVIRCSIADSTADSITDS